MRKLATPSYELAHLCRHGDRAAAEVNRELDFAVSVNPLGPPPSVLSSLRGALVGMPPPLRSLANYPDPDSMVLAERLARRHGISAQQVVIGNGANDLIYAAARALRPRRVAIAEPTYTEYLRSSLLVGALVTHWFPQDEDFLPRPFDPEDADLVWLCNPNNPTGRLWPAGSLLPWIEAHPRTVFIVDEAFMPFREDETDHSLIPSLKSRQNVIIIRSMTKIYALAGLRLGYAVTSPRLASRLKEQLVPWAVNALAQVAGVAALDDGNYLATSRAWLGVMLSRILPRLANCSRCLRPVASEANFVLVHLSNVTAGWLSRRLAERGIAIRDASNFIGLDSHYVRFSLRRPDDNERLLRELRHVFLEG
jgi:threonine-phosphate decarboxylase